MSLFDKYGYMTSNGQVLISKVNRLVEDFIKNDPELNMAQNYATDLRAFSNAISSSIDSLVTEKIMEEVSRMKAEESRTENNRIFDIMEAGGHLTTLNNLHAEYQGSLAAKIPMIREVRRVTGCSLLDGKNFIERGWLFKYEPVPVKPFNPLG